MAYSASSDIGSRRVEIPASAGFAFTPRVAAVYNARARKPRPPMFRMVTKLLNNRPRRDGQRAISKTVKRKLGGKGRFTQISYNSFTVVKYNLHNINNLQAR